LTDVLEVRIVEMGKAHMPGSPSSDDRLGMWLQFLEFGERKEVTNMLAQKDPAISQAVERLEEMSKDENEWVIAFERDKAQAWDAMNRYARKEHLRKASALAAAEGMAKGMAEGLVEGLVEAKLECAQRLLGLGLDNATVSAGTGLSVEEVERVRIEGFRKSEDSPVVTSKDD
jgi:predicted transposase/invertase (TIGR01784 family)